MPELPVIPLGVHAEKFDFSKSFSLQSRQKLNIKPESIVVLFVGRLAFHGKAHPAMYQALEDAAVAGKKLY